jgi:hypothetical protein
MVVGLQQARELAEAEDAAQYFSDDVEARADAGTYLSLVPERAWYAV